MIRLPYLACCITLFTSATFARGKSTLPAEKDSFDVVGHIALNEGVVDHLASTKHFSSNYIYAESSSSNSVTVIDVTDTSHPKLLSSVTGAGSVISAAGNAALVGTNAAAPAPARTISILDFSDKARPRVLREFNGVTSVSIDEPRGLIFLVNAEGLWILHRNQLLDPEIQERYAHDVLYSH